MGSDVTQAADYLDIRMRSPFPRPRGSAMGNQPWHKRSSRDMSRHAIASAHSMCPSKPSDVAMSR
jgi:hypothetical protein